MSLLHTIRGYRGRVFNVYWTFFLIIVLGWLFLVTANIIRYEGFPWFYGLITQFIPAVIIAYANDPLLIVAFIIGVLFFWSCPWGKIFGGSRRSQYMPDDFRRGRRISGPQGADYTAYKALVRQRNRRRNRKRLK